MRIDWKHWAFWMAMIVALSFGLVTINAHKYSRPDEAFIGFIVLFDVIGLTIWYVRRFMLR
jgi:hypothetical protein